MGMVCRTGPSSAPLPEFSGDAKTLQGAMKSACHAIGLAFANWMPIGPAIEMRD
jgi:hypothetical protein